MKIAICGSSRGLGAQLTSCIQAALPQSELLLSARKQPLLEAQARPQDSICVADYSRPEGQNHLCEQLLAFRPERVFYVAGGGPHGPYGEKAWRDHLWALEVGLIFPAKLIHLLLTESAGATPQQIVLVGSAIAGAKPDPLASSYAAAKHGLRGLVTSVQGEGHACDIRLYEPGYMATDMLPPHAWPRQQGLAKDPGEEARQLWQWSQT